LDLSYWDRIENISFWKIDWICVTGIELKIYPSEKLIGFEILRYWERNGSISYMARD